MLFLLKKIKMIITASIVLYQTNPNDLYRLLDCIHESKIINKVYLIDNSIINIDYNLSNYHLVSYIRLNKNIGYGAGHNIAIRFAQKLSTFHFVINPDIYFDALMLEKMVNRMLEDESIGQLMPKVLYPNGEIQYLCKLIPSPFDLIFRRFLKGIFMDYSKKREEIYELRFTNYSSEMNVPYLSGCFMLFRVACFQVIGIFDERFFMYPEDIDITRRMHMKFKTIYYPEAVIFHDYAKDSYKSKKMLWVHMKNMIKYFNKWGWYFDSNRKFINNRVIQSLKK